MNKTSLKIKHFLATFKDFMKDHPTIQTKTEALRELSILEGKTKRYYMSLISKSNWDIHAQIDEIIKSRHKIYKFQKYAAKYYSQKHKEVV